MMRGAYIVKKALLCTHVHRPLTKVPVILVILLINLEYFRQILEKFSNIKLHENQFNGSRFVPYRRTDRCIQTDRQDETNNRFSRFCEGA